ncbi:MAG: hypothetical protein U0324_47000 [Polyangiales bacterium]
MARAHAVALTIAGLRVDAWDEVTVTLDMLRPGSPWTVTLWRKGRGVSWERVRAAAQVWAPVTLEVDGAVQLRGQVERIRDAADRAGAPLTLGGRDALAAALVSDVDPRLSLRDATLEEVMRRAIEPLGLAVTVGANADEVRAIQAGRRPGAAGRASRRQHVDRYKPKMGEKVWAFLEGLARRHGFLLFAAPTREGTGLVVDRPAYDSAPVGTLVRRRLPSGEYEGNVLSLALDLNAAEVPTVVTVTGHSRLGARQDARHQATLANDRIRTAVQRVAATFPPRPRYLRDPHARTLQIAEQRARRELTRAMAEFAVVEATVQGFSTGPQASAPLWTINSMVTLDDEVTGVRGAWLVTQVTFQRSRAGGHTTRLRLVPPGAIDVEPDPEV